MLIAENEQKENIQQLFRQIVSYAESSVDSNFSSPSSQTAQTILKLNIDDYCYTLLRSKIQPEAKNVSLSPREQEIARLVAKGLPNKAIAQLLEISPWTVSTHIRRVFAKLNVSSRAEMVAHVMQSGLLST